VRPFHLAKLLTLTGACLQLLVLASCQRATGARMTVRSSTPRNGAVDVHAGTTVRVIFSYKVDMSTVTSASFHVSSDASGQISGFFTYDDASRTVTFTPLEPLPLGEEITVVLRGSIRSSAGTPIGRTTFRFRVSGDEAPPEDPGDDDPPPVEPPATPTIIHTIPKPFAASVARDQVIEVVFSHFINPFAVSVDAASVVGEISGPIPVRIEGLIETGTTMRLVPDRPFAPGERVTVNVLAGLVTIQGGVFAGASFFFHAAADPDLDGERTPFTFTATGRVLALLTVDLDGDSLPEIVYSTENGTRVEVLRHVGEGVLESVMSLDATERILSLGAGDVNSDGQTDLLVGLDDRLASVLNQTNAGTGLELEWGPDAVTRSGVRAIRVANLDNRWPLDIILDTDTGLQILREGLEFGVTQHVGTTRHSRSALVDADVNDDGRVDIVYSQSGDRGIAYHLGQADGSLGPAISIALDAEVEQVAVGDLDGDEVADILALLLLDVEYPDSPFRLLTRDAETGEFPSVDAPVAAATTLESTRFALGDLDGDGSLDLLLAVEADDDVKLFDAPSLGAVFPNGAPERLTTVSSPGEIRLADIGGDGSLDVVIASGNELRLLLSEGVAAPPPPPPVELTLELRAPTLTVRQGDAALHALLTLSNSVDVDGVSIVLNYDPNVVSSPSFDVAGTVIEGAEFAAPQLHEQDNAISYHAILEFFPPFEGRTVPPGTDHELLRLVFDVPLDAPLGESSLSFARAAGTTSGISSIFVGANEELPDLFDGAIVVEGAPPPPPSSSPDVLRVESASVSPGGTIRIAVTALSERDIEAFTVVIAYPSDAIEIVDLTIDGSDTAALSPDMVVPSDHPVEGFFAFSALIDLFPPFDSGALLANETHTIFNIDLRVVDGTPPGDYALVFTDGLGTPTLDNLFSAGGQSYFPSFAHGTITVLDDVEPRFVRGDVNGDSFVDSTDSIFLLNWAFRASKIPTCMDAADVNDDGSVNVTDSTWILDFVLNGGSRPPLPPFPGPGIDPTDDALDCENPLSP
jgi:hypothetical protein